MKMDVSESTQPCLDDTIDSLRNSDAPCTIPMASYPSINENSDTEMDDQNEEDMEDGNKKEVTMHQDTDRGYAWIVLIAGVLTAITEGAVDGPATHTYKQLLTRFDMSATATGWVFSLYATVQCLSSPFITLLGHRMSYRSMAVVGGVLNSSGLLIMAFTTKPWMLYIGFGMLSGIGSNGLIMATYVMFTVYFVKKQTLAMALYASGFGIGSIIFNPIVAYMYDNYTFTMTVTALAGLTLQQCIFGALLRPVQQDKVKSHSTIDKEVENSVPQVSCNVFKKSTKQSEWCKTL